MSAPVQNPPTPHLQPIPGGFSPGCIAHVTGTFTPGAASLIVKFQSGTAGDPTDDIGLCIYGRVREGQLGRNCFTRGVGWGAEELTPAVQGLAPSAAFDLTVLSDPQQFKIAFNGRHVCEFNHRVNPSSLSYLQVASLPGDLSLSCVWIEQPAAPMMQQQQQQSMYASAPPPAAYGAPPPPYSSAPAPGALPYNPNPQSGYAPPPGMAQPQMYPGQQQPYSGQQQPYPGQQQLYMGQQPYQGGHHKEKGLSGMISGAAGALGASQILGKATKALGIGGHNSGYPSGGGGYPNSGGAYPSSGGAYPGAGGAYPGGYGSSYPSGGGGGSW